MEDCFVGEDTLLVVCLIGIPGRSKADEPNDGSGTEEAASNQGTGQGSAENATPEVDPLVPPGARYGQLHALLLHDMNSENVNLGSFRGTPLLVNVWATWCTPCIAEFPELNTIYQRFAPQGLSMVGISIDRDDVANVAAFAEEHGLAYPVWHDHYGRAEGLFGPLLPSTYIYDRTGELVFRRLGVISTGELEQLLGELVASD